MLADSKRVLEARAAKPLSLAADETRAQTYDWVAGEGEFVDAPAILLDNQVRNGRAGVRAYRIFKPIDAPSLLIELGWLPLPADRTLPKIERPQGQLSISGLLSQPPAKGITYATTPGDVPEIVLVTAIDTAYDGQWLGHPDLSPRVLRLDPAMTGIGYVRDLDILPNTMPPERHIAYAVQWFGLALAVLATAALLTFRRRRSGRAKMTA
jgi:cytochrome oxidase assembly protein ShyY1